MANVRLHDLNDIVIFDGVCTLCAHSIRFILNHEANQTLRFAPLQSMAGARLMREVGFDPDDAKTIVLLANGEVDVKSDAAIRILGYFRWPWTLLRVIRIIPRPIRDGVYDLIARKRYQWFGRFETCMLPDAKLRARFID
jgi:predicted DCC family thiol-disulfide oxidoreductase YuxK